MSCTHVQSTILGKHRFLHKCPNPNVDGSMLCEVLHVRNCIPFKLTKSHCSQKPSAQISKLLRWYCRLAHICNSNGSNTLQHLAVSYTPLATLIFFFRSFFQYQAFSCLSYEYSWTLAQNNMGNLRNPKVLSTTHIHVLTSTVCGMK